MKTISDIQQLLSSNGGAVLDNITQDELEDYKYIKDHLHQSNIIEDEEFQQRFARLHQFKRNRIKPAIQKTFFEVLEEQKNAEELDAKLISRAIFGANMKGQYRSQYFSLISRMMHTINDEFPIYNKELIDFFEIVPPKQTTDDPAYKKLNAYLRVYNQIIDTYKEIVAQEKLSSLLKVVRIKHSAFKEYLSVSKRLDLILRSSSELERKGKLLRYKRAIT